MRNDVIEIETLCAELELETDETGDTIQQHVFKTVFAEKKSVKLNEFYAAHTARLKPEITFEICPDDYEGGNIVKSEGREYRILRTFKKNNDVLELILEGGVYANT